jgi:glycosyltransferase involved in cell wall biosynthesis
MIDAKMSSVRKIAYLVSQYPAVNHTYILREIRELRRLGWEIHVASIGTDTRPVSQMTGEERDELSHTWYVKAQGVAGALRAHFQTLFTDPCSYVRGMQFALGLGGIKLNKVIRNLFYFTEALIVGQWLRKSGLSHIHIHYSSTVGLFIAKTFPMAISMTIHGSGEFLDPIGFHLREKIEASAFVCAISRYGRDQLKKNSNPDQWNKLETLRLGIDLEKFAPSRRLSVDRPRFELISVGRLSREKAQRNQIVAVLRLVREGRQVRLRLVGEGPDRAELEQFIVECGLSDYVKLEGALNQDQLKGLYQESDAFVLSSLAEGVPVVLMEAMAMELPCVASRITGIPELIQDGVEGLLVPPNDVGGLAAALARLIDDPDLRTRLALAGRQKVIRQYDLSKNAALLAAVFERRIAP